MLFGQCGKHDCNNLPIDGWNRKCPPRWDDDVFTNLGQWNLKQHNQDWQRGFHQMGSYARWDEQSSHYTVVGDILMRGRIIPLIALLLVVPLPRGLSWQ